MTDAARTRADDRATEAGRVVGFSDALFPIIITLLVIEIRLPHSEPGHLAEALIHAWPSYAAFALAFVYIGVIWLNHHGLFRTVSRTDWGLSSINLGILGTSALIPFPTAVLAEALQGGNADDQRAAVVLYGLVAGVMSAAWAPVFPYLERRRARLAPDVPPGYFASQRSRPWVGVAAYAIAIVLGWMVSQWLAIAIFVAMVIFHAWTSEGFVPAREPASPQDGDIGPPLTSR